MFSRWLRPSSRKAIHRVRNTACSARPPVFSVARNSTKVKAAHTTSHAPRGPSATLPKAPEMYAAKASQKLP